MDGKGVADCHFFLNNEKETLWVPQLRQSAVFEPPLPPPSSTSSADWQVSTRGSPVGVSSPEDDDDDGARDPSEQSDPSEMQPNQ